jgi:hypothetical protein
MLTGGGSSTSVAVTDEEISKLKDVPVAADKAPAKSLAYGMHVAARKPSAAAPAAVVNSAPTAPSERPSRSEIFEKLDGRDLAPADRENLLAMYWSDVGKSSEVNQEIFRGAVAALNPLLDSSANPDQTELRSLVYRSVSLMVATNPDPTLAVQDVAGFLERVPSPQMRKIVVDSFSGSYYDGKAIIRRELASRALPVSEDETDSATAPDPRFPPQAVPVPPSPPRRRR